ncbi:MAG: hypothetical protein IT320_27570 [Anaerolineae bacterium]|nr:hypothetical protein [Anaerolineae bacterium]
MKRVTRDIDPESAHDLLERVPRACIAFAREEGPIAQPVALIWRDGRYQVGVPSAAARRPDAGDEVVLLVDEGRYFFDLRAIYIRGLAEPVDAPEAAPEGHTWYEITPTRTVAWDYGSLREVDDDR